MTKDKYEISIWKDVPDGNYFKEEKIAVIGSDSIESPYCAFDPVLVENINGSNTFTFKMLYYCKDQDLDSFPRLVANPNKNVLEEINQLYYSYQEFAQIPEEGYINPFITLMSNERKVKVYWKNKWYDLIIKNCQEDTTNKTITYTCSDAYINELAKNGFQLIFDNELMNNQGTACELGARIVDGTEWRVLDAEGKVLEVANDGINVSAIGEPVSEGLKSDIIQQENEEAVFEMTLLTEVTVTDLDLDQEITLPRGSQILLFYSIIANLVQSADKSGVIADGLFQFAYSSQYETDTTLQLLSNVHRYSIPVVYWTKNDTTDHTIILLSINNVLHTINFKTGVSSRYRAKHLIQAQLYRFDSSVKKFVSVYRLGDPDSGQEIYSYRDVDTEVPTAVVNILANSTSFTNTNGWIMENPRFVLYPLIDHWSDVVNTTAKSYLRISSSFQSYNNGITACSNFLPDGLQAGTKYIFRYKIVAGNESAPSSAAAYVQPHTINGWLGKYLLYGTNHEYRTRDINNPIASFGTAVQESDGWAHREVTINRSVSRTELYNEQIGFFILCDTIYAWIEEVQFFKKVEASNELGFVTPNQFADDNPVNIRYNYYYPNSQYSSINDITFAYQGIIPQTSINGSPLYAAYNSHFEKIRSISGKQSNRFNLLQNLAEQFGCWIKFYIAHDDSGHILYDDLGVAKKYIYFLANEKFGSETGLGFVYGIDLKSIQRTVQSDNIVTKTIVPSNNNEFALYGSCDISRAAANYPKNNCIYNFTYYVNQGMLDSDEVNRDLYSTANGAIGYYTNLHLYYTQYDDLIQEITQLEMERLKVQNYRDLFNASVTASQEAITSYKTQICYTAGFTNVTDANVNASLGYIQSNYGTNDSIRNLIISYTTAKQELANYVTQLSNCISSLAGIENRLDLKRMRQAHFLRMIKLVEAQFFKKYSRFIQEGSWQSDEYIDDNLYYLDGVEVASRSSRPQISYNISVLRLTSIEEFRNKVFNLGDIVFVQDKEFFGYTNIDGIKTPYKEKVLVSEITSYFEEPEKDNIKVQNYKSSFDDLFQRITATTQSLQYQEGNYQRAANAITNDRSIRSEVLQNAFDNNYTLAMGDVNNTIIIEPTKGIIIADNNDNQNQIKLNANGLFITVDGGLHWKNAIKGTGLSTEALAAGAINAEQITIYQGNAPTFRWDATGISAYSRTSDSPTGDIYIDPSSFVRMDQYGIYGVRGITSDNWVASNIDDVKNTAQFGLTWDSFWLKNETGQNQFEISSTGLNITQYGLNSQQEIDRTKYLKIGLDGNKVISVNNGSKETFYITADGDAYFAGDITGATGNFSGTITATSGSIGGWNIKADGLYADAGNIYITPSSISYGTTWVLDRNGGTIGGLQFDADGFTYINPGDYNANCYIGPAGISFTYQVSYRIATLPTQLYIGPREGESSLSYYNSDVFVSGWYVVLVAGEGHLAGGTWYGTLSQSSDQRLKNTIQNLDEHYETFFNSLQPKSFYFNDQTGQHIGFIAQEVIRAQQMATLEDFGVVRSYSYDKTMYYSLTYHEFIALNTWQIQKLKARVTELETKIVTLENKI